MTEPDLEVRVGEYGHLWQLLKEGSYTVTVRVEGFQERTKVVPVVTRSFTSVVFTMPVRETSLPRYILSSNFSLLGTKP